MTVLAGLAFVAIFFVEVPFPAIVLFAAAAGYVVGRWRPSALEESGGEAREEPSEAGPEVAGSRLVPSWKGALRTATLWLTVWWAPVVALVLVAGTSSVLVTQAVFFSKVAVVTFGRVPEPGRTRSARRRPARLRCDDVGRPRCWVRGRVFKAWP